MKTSCRGSAASPGAKASIVAGGSSDSPHKRGAVSNGNIDGAREEASHAAAHTTSAGR